MVQIILQGSAKASSTFNTYVTKVANKVRSECTSLVSTKAPLILCKKDNAMLTRFNWEDLVKDWENRAPTFLTLLTAATDKHWHTKAETISTKYIPLTVHGWCNSTEDKKRAHISLADHDLHSAECWSL